MQKEKIAKIMDLIISESILSTMKKEPIQENEPFVSTSINQNEAGTSTKRPRLFDYMPPADQMIASASTNDEATVVKEELDTYLEEGVLSFYVNPLRYWYDT